MDIPGRELGERGRIRGASAWNKGTCEAWTDDWTYCWGNCPLHHAFRVRTPSDIYMLYRPATVEAHGSPTHDYRLEYLGIHFESGSVCFTHI